MSTYLIMVSSWVLVDDVPKAGFDIFQLWSSTTMRLKETISKTKKMVGKTQNTKHSKETSTHKLVIGWQHGWQV